MRNARNKRLTDGARQLDVVILAVHLLGGSQKSVDTEDVAVKADELAPGMFSWRKYPEQINLELVRVALSDAKKPNYGQLLSGSGREGWRLSTAGLEWVRSSGEALLAEELTWTSESRSAGSVDTVRKQREEERIMASSAWRAWREGGAVSLRQAQEVLRIDNYSTKKMIQIKLVRLRSLFDDDSDIGIFLKETERVVRSEGR